MKAKIFQIWGILAIAAYLIRAESAQDFCVRASVVGLGALGYLVLKRLSNKQKSGSES